MAVLRDQRFSARMGQEMRRRQDHLPLSMLNTDPPEHTRLRSSANRVFHARAVERLRPHVQAIIDEMLNGLGNQDEIEVISEFASPLAIKILAGMLGVPDHDLANFHHLTQAASGNLDPLASPDVQQSSSVAASALADYFAHLITNLRSSPGQDFLSMLLQVVDEQQLLTTDEVITMCNLLVIGGHEPTVHLIGNGLLALLHHPDQLRHLREKSLPLDAAVEELLRFDSPIQLAARVAVEDVEIGGRIVRAGQAVVPLIGAANHDPAIFADPEVLDLGRSPNPHLSLGGGAHLCLGAPLVRLVAQCAFGSFIERFPKMQMATASPEWSPSLVPRGLKSLAINIRD
jgi:cytochrome P450